MPEGDVRIGGLDTHIPRKNFPFVLVGGALAAYILFLRPRGTAQPNIAGSVAAAQAASDQTSLEFAQLQSQVQLQLAQLAASTAVEKQQLNQQYQLAAGLNPGLQTQCIPLIDWYNTQTDIRGNLVQQVRDGQLYMSIGPQGVCFSPTQQGIAGHPPIVKNTTGLFSSSTRGYATTAQPAPQPGIYGVLGQILPYAYGYPY
jgi:hypothetical protein